MSDRLSLIHSYRYHYHITITLECYSLLEQTTHEWRIVEVEEEEAASKKKVYQSVCQ